MSPMHDGPLTDDETVELHLFIGRQLVDLLAGSALDVDERDGRIPPGTLEGTSWFRLLLGTMLLVAAVNDIDIDELITEAKDRHDALWARIGDRIPRKP